MKLVSVFAFLALCMSACVPGLTTRAGPPRPQWIDTPGQYFKGQKVVYGVGSASNIPEVGMRRDAASADAALKLAQAFRVRVKGVFKKYSEFLAKGGQGGMEQVIQNVQKNIVNEDLSGIPVVEHFFDTSENTGYALVIMDSDSFMKQLEKMRDLSTAQKQALRGRAKEAWEGLEEDVARAK